MVQQMYYISDSEAFGTSTYAEAEQDNEMSPEEYFEQCIDSMFIEPNDEDEFDDWKRSDLQYA